MTTYTVLDVQGEVVSVISVSDALHLDLNVPAGCVALLGRPPTADGYYALGAWCTRPLQPTSDHAWDPVRKAWADPRTLAQRKDAARVAFENAAQVALDGTAHAWGYDSIVSAASYAASTNRQFAAEAAALIAWRDAVWVAAYALQTRIAAGAQPLPETAAAFLLLLPPAPKRPA